MQLLAPFLTVRYGGLDHPQDKCRYMGTKKSALYLSLRPHMRNSCIYYLLYPFPRCSPVNNPNNTNTMPVHIKIIVGIKLIESAKQIPKTIKNSPNLLTFFISAYPYCSGS